MTNAMALKELQDYYDTDNPTEDDEFRFTEALGYLIDQTKDPKYMYELGWFYCSKKRFDLEIRYLEMAAEYGFIPAMEELGYMWYYGQHGQKDYDKAFYYFSKGAAHDESNGGLWCKYKLADMYSFGCAVEKDEDKYREMIEEAYEQVRDELEHKEIDIPRIADLIDTWIDCQKTFTNKMGRYNPYNLEEALIASDIVPEGHQHDGMADAYNTAKLFAKLSKNPNYELNRYYSQARVEEIEHLSFCFADLIKDMNFCTA